MKRYLAILLAVFVTLSCVACSGKKKDNPKDKDENKTSEKGDSLVIGSEDIIFEFDSVTINPNSDKDKDSNKDKDSDKDKDTNKDKDTDKDSDKDTNKDPEKEPDKEPEKEPDKEPDKEPEKETDKDVIETPMIPLK